MPFTKGHKIKSPGRPKGAVSKKLKEFREVLDYRDFNLAEQAVILYRGGECSASEKIQILRLLADFTVSKPSRKVELAVDAEGEIDVTPKSKLADVSTSDLLTALDKLPKSDTNE